MASSCAAAVRRETPNLAMPQYALISSNFKSALEVLAVRKVRTRRENPNILTQPSCILKRPLPEIRDLVTKCDAPCRPSRWRCWLSIRHI